jgi:hypothetical protein
VEDTQDGKWLSYAELAAIRGINRASAVKLVQRERWRRSSGNDRARTIRVLVPTDWLAPARERPVASGDAPTTSREDTRHLAATIASLTSAFDTATAALREQLARAEQGRELERARADATNALVDQTMAALADANARTDRAEAQATELRALLEQAEAAAEQARRKAVHEAREAAQALDALRAVEAARLAQGLLARLRAAWRGR